MSSLGEADAKFLMAAKEYVDSIPGVKKDAWYEIGGWVKYDSEGNFYLRGMKLTPDGAVSESVPPGPYE